jgi:hypothetical protein
VRPVAKRARLPEPITVAEFWRNRGGESVRIELREYEGHVVVDVRVHFPDATGILRPSKKGVCLTIHKLPELVRGISKALTRARELNLIADEAADG